MRRYLVLFLVLAFTLSAFAQQDRAKEADQLFNASKRLEALPLYEQLARDNPNEMIFARRLADCYLAKAMQMDAATQKDEFIHFQTLAHDYAKKAIALGDTTVYIQLLADSDPNIISLAGQQEETIEVVVVEKVIERAEVEEIKQELEPTPEPQAAEAPVAPETHSTPAPSVAAESEPEPELAPEPVLAQPQPATPIKHTIKPDDDKNSPFSILVGQVYEGPMDLLLDLIRKQDIDIYDIPIAKITEQFLFYVEHMRASEMDIAGEFIYTASLLIHIKSKMLLPRAPSGPEDLLDDPRRELVERLLEHERFKNAAQMLQQKQMIEAATWSNPGIHEFKGDEGTEPELAADTVDLARVFQEILERFKNRPIINVEEDQVTVGQMIQFLGRRLNMEDKPIALRKLLAHTHSRRALVAMFLALLELVRLQAILLRQDRLFSEIFIKKHADFDSVMTEGFMAARDDWG